MVSMMVVVLRFYWFYGFSKLRFAVSWIPRRRRSVSGVNVPVATAAVIRAVGIQSKGFTSVSNRTSNEIVLFPSVSLVLRQNTIGICVFVYHFHSNLINYRSEPVRDRRVESEGTCWNDIVFIKFSRERNFVFATSTPTGSFPETFVICASIFNFTFATGRFEQGRHLVNCGRFL